MSLHKQPELKEAVLNLPQKEKDKLLVRLVGKDKMLMKQLHYQLLEDQLDLDDRITKLKEDIQAVFKAPYYKIENTPTYSHYKDLQSLLRHASGIINEHEKVTKDKFSEVECRVYILKEAFDSYPKLFADSYTHSSEKLREYTKGRLKATLGKYDKLHEDLQFDLQDEVEALITFGTEYGLL